MKSKNLEKITGFETEKGSKYTYQNDMVIRKRYDGIAVDNFDLNVFIPPYNKLDKSTQSKLKALHNIDENSYEDFISGIVYNPKYLSHVYLFEDNNLKKINNNQEIKGKAYFVSRGGPDKHFKNNIAFLVEVAKEPEIGYFPYQENNTNKGYYVYHLGDKISSIDKARV
ncbi:hypothetical protein M1137_02635 [Candidatus Parvarchaeota archaeon]|nr:hypothetical protein [Candidatus Parvarchaeota archaeon]